MIPSSNGGKVVRNSTVEFRCTVDKNILGHGTVGWYRRQGMNRYQLGTGVSVNSYLTIAPRYHLAIESQTPATAVYWLTISGLSLTGIFMLICFIFILCNFYALP